MNDWPTKDWPTGARSRVRRPSTDRQRVSKGSPHGAFATAAELAIDATSEVSHRANKCLSFRQRNAIGYGWPSRKCCYRSSCGERTSHPRLAMRPRPTAQTRCLALGSSVEVLFSPWSTPLHTPLDTLEPFWLGRLWHPVSQDLKNLIGTGGLDALDCAVDQAHLIESFDG